MTEDQLKKILPRCTAAVFVDPLNDVCNEFGIDTPARLAAFLATIGHESSQLTVFSENLNYGAPALVSRFPTHFPNLSVALQYARQPEKIANRLYANREGNGDEVSGDGWRYRGAGAVQLTFHDNQKACADYFRLPLSAMEGWLRTPTGALRSAGWFWWRNRCNPYADAGDFDGVCDIVNRGRKTTAIGDSIGWAERLALFNTAKGVLA